MGFLPDGPHQLRLGLSRTGAWLELDEHVGADLAARRALVFDRPDDVVAWLDDATVLTACVEARDALSASAGVTANGGDAHPVLAIASSIADDVCVLDGTSHTLVAGAVCFPNRWVLAEKLGRHVTEVHEPVPGYATALATRVDTVLGRLRPGQVLERRNWSMLDDPAMHQPVRGAARTVEDPGTQVWARVERQALVRLPASGAIVFTIRTRQRALGELDADDRTRLRSLLSTVPDDALTYKSLVELRDPVLAWLGAGAD